MGLTKRKEKGPIHTNEQEDDGITPERMRWSNYRRFRNRESYENEEEEQETCSYI